MEPQCVGCAECMDAPLVPVLNGVIAAAEAMLSEAQQEARYCSDAMDKLACLAKRDALAELLDRLKRGKRNPRWATLRPSMEVIL